MPDDPRQRPEKLEATFTHFDSIALVGHTHLPGIFSTHPHLSFKTQKELGEEPIPIGTGKTIVNVGSVGQPRDQDPRACYVLCKNTEKILTVQFRRVPYDIAKAMARIHSYSRLPSRNAERLGEGC
jgi:diadenosine tetraphosphatase ApaH/serine/threonine PP2A family protein phosphatase